MVLMGRVYPVTRQAWYLMSILLCVFRLGKVGPGKAAAAGVMESSSAPAATEPCCAGTKAAASADRLSLLEEKAR